MKRLMLILVLCLLSFSVLAANRVLLLVTPGCKYCAQAKVLLNQNGIKYQTQVSREGPVPKLYVDGKLQGIGLDAVKDWIASQRR